MSEGPRVDRAFVEKFFTSVDRPLEYGVYFLFHDWWEKAPQEAIDAYLKELHDIPEATACLEERFIAEPLTLDRLAECAPGTLGHGYRKFITENNLEANLGRNYHDFNTQLHANGKLDRLPDEMSYMMIRGFQIHDFLHVLTGYEATYYGELALASFYLAQLRFPYHAMRLAVTMAHTAFLRPGFTVEAMDAFVDGWALGRSSKNLNFDKWEDEIDTPLSVLRQRMQIATTKLAA